MNYGIEKALFRSEFFGCVLDLIYTNSLLLFAFPLFLLIYRSSARIADWSFVVLIAALSSVHIFILKYFLYQRSLLDTSLYKYSVKEILFTVRTSEVSFLKLFLLIVFLLAFLFVFNRFLRKIILRKGLLRLGCGIFMSAIPLFILIELTNIHLNKYSINKSNYFYSRSLSYFANSLSKKSGSSDKEINEFWRLYPDKTFLTNEYPLLHEFKNINVLKPYFNKFSSTPNIVLLIVEGLNDDFIHPYKTIQLMPFLSSLTEKSLYWNRCFTLGERSFAVVPSVLGSLPYGKTGFTLLDKLPRHLSLVSILHANNYQTDFFYGQAAWFHQKDRFFGYNNIDLIFDNSKFSEEYEKIIVGNDHFFWGFNDKDLFNQSMEVIDTLPSKPRLDIYFTGTTHSPFAISNPDRYNQRFSKILQELKSDSTKMFFNTYKKYIQTILFADDALELFFKKYESRPEYANTIFIITGDHPMTEIPIANSLKRYHVPLIIFSKKLSLVREFTHTVSHLDVYESLLSFLADYNVKIPEISTALGSNLILDQSDKEKRIAFMNDNREVIDFYSDNFFLTGDILYKVGKDLTITAVEDATVMRKMKQELEIVKNTSLNASVSDKIIPDSLYYKSLGYCSVLNQKPDSVTYQFNTEYYTVVNSTVLKNKPIYFDISFEMQSDVDKGLCVVYQLKTKNDSLLFWQGTDITESKKTFCIKTKIPKQKGADSVMYFTSYFWNKNKKEAKFKNLNISIHQPSN